MDNNKKDGSRGFLGRWLAAFPRKLTAYLKHHFPSTLFVTACVTILHLSTSSFDAFDSYTFLWMGNFASESSPIAEGEPRIAVVEIDDQTFENDFGGRSPLDRAQILSLLQEIYAAHPTLVVVDLDLAPTAKSLVDPSERDADDAIQKLILDNGRGTSTVLLEPFPVQNGAWKETRDSWRRKIECRPEVSKNLDCVIFANGDIPERFGMSHSFYLDQKSFFTSARRASGSGHEAELTEVLVARKKLMIDPRTYMGKLKVITTTQGQTDPGLAPLIRCATGGGCVERGIAQSSESRKPNAERVVYFGAGHGADDLFTTPLGRLYGVELHAAAFATCWKSHDCSRFHERMHHLKALFADLVVALALGWFIAFSWGRYIEWRMHPDPEVSEVAGIIALRLMIFLLLTTLGLTAFAGWLLARSGVWISPIPIAVGMFFEAWVLGPIAKHGARAAHSSPVVAGASNAAGPRPLITRKSLTMIKRVAMLLVVCAAAYQIWH